MMNDYYYIIISGLKLMNAAANKIRTLIALG